MTEEKNKGGRPSKYDPKYIQTIEEYIRTIPDRKNQLPKIVDIAIIIGVPQKTIYAWADKNPEFRKSLDDIINEQRKMLVDRGLFDKDCNSTITKLILMNNHGMAEKKETEETSKTVVSFNYVEPETPDEYKSDTQA